MMTASAVEIRVAPVREIRAPAAPAMPALPGPRKDGVLFGGGTAGRSLRSRPMSRLNHDSRAEDDPPDPQAWIDDIAPSFDGTDPADAGLGDAPPQAATDSYWSLSRTPLTSLVFALPLVLAYEGGVLLLGRGSPRNGADVWLRQLLDALGFGAYFLLPTLTVLGLLAWHHIEHDRWRFSPAVLTGMAAECVLWAATLVGLARLQDRLWPLAAAAAGWDGVFARLIGFCGAGLYEEVLFRLLLLPLLIWLCERLGASTVTAAIIGLVASSLLFSAAHYVGPLGDAFELYSFTFRFLAGMFFAILFVVRGFGIAAGTHAVYDVLVGLI
jgi:membrane protease YdiL (CAAX protease family)